jgi:Domain of unknown function (DUF1883)
MARIHLHQEVEVGPDEEVEVYLSGPANAILLDSTNYEHYRRGEPYEYEGGFAEDSPFPIEPPHPGRWHLVVDLGGYTGHVRAGYRILQMANASE